MSRTLVAPHSGTENRRAARENMQYKVLIADDHGVVRKGLRLLLEQYPELVVVGEAANGREAVTMAASLSPQVVVLDVAMPILNGIEAAEQILKVNSQVGVILLTMHADESYVLRALHAGVRGYLLKESAEDDLLAAIKSEGLDIVVGSRYVAGGGVGQWDTAAGDQQGVCAGRCPQGARTGDEPGGVWEDCAGSVDNSDY